MESSMEVPQKLKIDQPYNLGIPYLDIYLKECKPGYNTATCTSTFMTALFTISKLHKWLRYLTTDEQIKEMWYVYKMEYYSAIKNGLYCLQYNR
jgi:hypothetical protein